jgi:hypothetical protein
LKYLSDATPPPPPPVVIKPKAEVKVKTPETKVKTPETKPPKSPTAPKVGPVIAPIMVEKPMHMPHVLRRVSAVCGSGDATISIASFGGTVRLKKI